MPGTLYVVATPIGNLEDVTLRALRILRDVSLIAAEDTRRTARLLQHYSISTRTTSLHEHNEHARSAGLVAKLLAGESVALVSDAGTPGVSDPGRCLVSAAHEAGVRVEPVPGASAVMAAVSASGLDVSEFLYAGFPPNRSKARKEWLERLASEPRPLVVFEAPHRIASTLTEALAVLGDRPMLMARELTKVHETLVFRPISAHIEQLGEPKGEYTLVIAAPLPGALTEDAPFSADEARVLFCRMTENEGASPRTAIKMLGKRYGKPAREIYRAIHSLGSSVD